MINPIINDLTLIVFLKNALLNKTIMDKMQQYSAKNMCTLQLKIQFLIADKVPQMTRTRDLSFDSHFNCLPEVSCPLSVCYQMNSVSFGYITIIII